jgi:ribonuclease R
VFAILEGKKAEHQELLPHLETLKEVFHLLLRQRKIRGALEFETVETKIIFNDKQQIDRIVPTQRNYVHLIIEECMLAANFCASQFLSEHKKLAVLYRIHEGPDSEKLKTLRSFLRVLGLTLKGGDNPTPLHFSILLKQIEGRKDEALIETLVLRSMRRALYSRKNIGHFGLAYEGYVHFTSPIRRYPDLLIHRAIHFVINKGKLSGFHYGENAVDNFADYCSMTERRADDATRDAVYALKCSFMKEKLGQKFLGTVTNATNFGLFVVLDDVYVEGLLHVTSLENDYYSFDPQRIMLKGKRTGKTYKIGDKIKVLVARVDVDSREIDFELM